MRRPIICVVALMIMLAAVTPPTVARAQDVAPVERDDARESRTFPETGHTVSGRFLEYWEHNGGVAIFGFPISEEQEENGRRVQYFERQRFEWHPENRAPHDVLLGRLGDELLQDGGVDWRALPPADRAPGCLYIAATEHNICDQRNGIGFRSYWEGRNLAAARAGAAVADALALFGYPLTEAFLESTPDGDTVLVQWFERARFEWHPANPDEFKVLLGRLGAEIGSESPLESQPDGDLVQRAREALARHLRIAPQRLTLERADAEEWPSSAIGCPAADQLYLQVITPGWRLIFADGARSYAVHTNLRGNPLILCRNGQPTLLP